MKRRQLVMPSMLPLEGLKGSDLEECVYWLLDSMGAKDLRWRLGGDGGGATDGGRDLEAVFYVPQPDDEMQRQEWRVEAKGRGRTLESGAVKSAVMDVAAFPEVDALIIVTNTTFSNPTRDWVAKWQLEHRRPLVRLWDRHDLERMLCEHPGVVVRLFTEALSPQGQLEVVREQFWNYCLFAGTTTLNGLWDSRESMKWEPEALLAAIASEVSNDSLSNRPWGMWANEFQIRDVLTLAFLNVIYFVSRAHGLGRNEQPYSAAIAYLMLVSLYRFGAGWLHSVIAQFWETPPFVRFPRTAKDYFLSVPLSTLKNELAAICTVDCTRVSSDLVGENRDVNYWSRLREPSAIPGKTQQREQRRIVIESSKEPCKVGLKLGEKRSCPLIEDFNRRSLISTFRPLERIIHFRVNEVFKP